MVKQGLVQVLRIATTRCKSCFAKAYLTDWTPPTGLDQQLRQYECSEGHMTYRRLESKEEMARPAWI